MEEVGQSWIDPALLPPPRLHPASTPARTTPSRTLRHISLGRYTARKSSTSLAHHSSRAAVGFRSRTGLRISPRRWAGQLRTVLWREAGAQVGGLAGGGGAAATDGRDC